MGQTQAGGANNTHRQQQAQQLQQQQHQQHKSLSHPTASTYARVADFVDPNGQRLLTEAGGFTELFAGPPALPPRLLRAVWRLAAASRSFLTAEDVAELHDALAGGGIDAQRRLLTVLVTDAAADEKHLGESTQDATTSSGHVAKVILEAAWLPELHQGQSANAADCLRDALARLLRPALTALDDTESPTPSLNSPAVVEEIVRLTMRHAPHLLADAADALLARMRSPTYSLTVAPSWRLPDDVLDAASPESCWLDWALACQLPRLFTAGMTTGQLLYDTNRELRSPSQFAQLVFDYGGPTLLLVTDAEGRLFCAAADRGLREAWEPFGEEDTRLAQVLPELKLLLSGSGLLYANFKASVGRKGISVGRNPGQAAPVLLIGPELDTVSVYGVPLKLVRLRAIGLGDPGLVEKLRAERERDARLVAIARERKLRLQQEGTDGSAGWEQNVDRQLLEWGGVRNPGNNAQIIEGREAELGFGAGGGSADGGPARLLKPEF